MVRLKDPFDRPVSNLRVSLTSRCNLSCIYCHAEGEERPGDQLSCSEIAEILRVADKFEIRHVKFTGGEPCLREDLAEIVSLVPDKMECSLTTNGTLLADMAGDLADAGLSRVNISIDSLNRETYTKIAGKDCLSDVLAGIEAALDAKLVPVKLNMVVLSGINDHEVDDFVRFVRGNRNLVLQLIELLGFRDCDHHYDLRDLETRLAKNAREIFTRRMHHRRKYCVDNAEVEIVSVRVKGRARAVGPVAFGASDHVARIVLTAMKFDPDVRCAANIRYTPGLVEACEEMLLSVCSFDRESQPPGVKTMDWGVASCCRDGVPDVIYDRGAVGKEAMIRILGEEPGVVVNNILKLSARIDKD